MVSIILACCICSCKKGNHSNVSFVTTAVLKRVTWKDMLNQFMKERSHSNVKFVTTAVLEKVTWINMLHQFMRVKSHSNVTYVNTTAHKRATWKFMLHQFIKERSHSTVIFVMLRFLITVIWRGMFLEFMKEVNSELSWINFKYLQTIFWFTLFWMFEYFWGWHENYQTKLRNTNYIEIKKRRLFLLLEADFFPWFKTFPEMSLNFCKSRVSW